MLVLSCVLFIAAAASALLTLGVTISDGMPRMGQVWRVMLGRPEGLPPLPPRRMAMRRVRVMRVAPAAEWRAAA